MQQAIQALLNIRDHVSEIANNASTLDDAVEQDPRIRPFVLGGLTEDGVIPNDSLAAITKQFLGVTLDDRINWVNYEQVGSTGDDHVAITTISTDYVSFLRAVNELSGEILEELGVSPSSDNDKAEYLLDNPDKTGTFLSELIQNILQLTANSCPFTFFAHTTREISPGYLIAMYPQLENNVENVAEFAGLEELYILDVEGSDNSAVCIGWKHKNGELLDQLNRLNQEIWSLFDDSHEKTALSLFFSDKPNPKEEFTQQAKEQLTASNWSYPEELPECEHPKKEPDKPANTTSDDRYEVDIDRTRSYIIEGENITAREARISVNTNSIRYREKELDEPEPLLRFINQIMPGVVFGDYIIETVELECRYGKNSPHPSEV